MVGQYVALCLSSLKEAELLSALSLLCLVSLVSSVAQALWSIHLTDAWEQSSELQTYSLLGRNMDVKSSHFPHPVPSYLGGVWGITAQ